MGARWNRWKKWGRIAVLLFLVVGAIASGWLWNWLGKDASTAWVLGRVLPLLDEALQGSLTVEGAAGSLRDGRIRLSGITLKDPEGNPVIQARTLTAWISLSALKEGTVRLREVVLDEPEARFIHDTRGWNLLRAVASTSPPDPTPSRPFPVDIVADSVRITSGTVTIQGLSSPVEIQELTLQGAVRVTGGASRVAVEVSHLGMEVPAPLGSPLSLSTSLEWTPRLLELHGLGLWSEDLVFAAWGKMLPGSSPQFDVQAGFSGLDLARVSPYVPGLSGPGGTAARFHAKGSLSDLHLEGNISLPRGSLSLEGKTTVNGPPFHFAGRIEAADLDPSSLGPLAPLPARINARVEGSVSVSSLTDLKAEADVEAWNSEVLGIPVTRLQTRASLEDSLISLEKARFDVASLTGALEAKASLVSRTFSVNGQVGASRLSSLGRFVPAMAQVGGDARIDLRAEGAWGLPGKGSRSVKIRARGKAHGRDLRVSQAGLSFLDGDFDLDFAGGQIRGGVTASVKGLSQGGNTWERLDITTRLAGNQASFTVDLPASAEGGDFLSVEGDMGFNPSRISLELSRFSGSWRGFAAVGAGTQAVEWHSREGLLQVDHLSLLRPDGARFLDARGLWQPGGRADLLLALTEFPLSTLSSSLSGILTFQGAVEGKGRSPDMDLEGSVREFETGPMEPVDASFTLLARQESLHVETRATRDAQPLFTVSGDLPLQVTLSGLPRLLAENPLDLKVAIPDQNLAAFLTTWGQPDPLPMQVRFGVEVHLTGTPRLPLADVEVRATPARAAGTGFRKFLLRAQGEGKEEGLNLTASLHGDELPLVDAELGMSGSPGVWLLNRVPGVASPPLFSGFGPPQAHLLIKQVPLSRLDSMLPSLEGVEGAVSADLTLGGTLNLPDAKGFLTWDQASVMGASLSPARLDLDLAGGKGGVEVAVRARDGWLIALGRLPVDLSGTAPAEGESGALHVAVDGSLFPPDPDGNIPTALQGARGILATRGRIIGTIREPRADLSATVSGASFCLKSTQVCYDEVELVGVATTRSLNIQKLHARARPAGAQIFDVAAATVTGTLDGKGSVDLFKDGKPPQVNLELQLEKFWATYTRSHQVLLTGRLSAQGAVPKLKVRGDLEVERARVRYGDEVRGSLTALNLPPDFHLIERRKQGPLPAALAVVPPGPFSNLWDEVMAKGDVAVKVRLTRDVWFRMAAGLVDGSTSLGSAANLFARITPELQLTGELALRNPLGGPALDGNIDVVRGNLGVLGKQFRVEEGEAVFTGSWPPDPRLNVTAAWTSRYGPVRVRLTGTVLSPQLSFSADDPSIQEESDIIAVLVAGRPLRELSGNQGAAVEQQATALLAGLAGSMVSQALGVTLFDRVQVDTSSGSSGTNASFELGKTIGTRLFFVTRYRITDDPEENQFEAQLEFQLSPRFFLEASYGDRGNGSFGLQYTRKF